VQSETSEDRIFILIEKAIAACESVELEQITAELRTALREHIRLTRTIALATLSSLGKRD